MQRLVERGDLRRVALGPHPAFRWSDVAGALGLTRDEVRLAPMLTLDQVAEWLGRSPRAVRELSEAGKLRRIRVGGCERWSSDEVVTFRAEEDGHAAA